MLRILKNILHILNLLSLDVVAGAVVSHLAFCKLVGVYNAPTTIVLGCATCIIYIMDRFLDIRRDKDIATERHLFHAKYQTVLSILVGFLSIITLIYIFELPYPILFFGIALLALTGIYTWFVFRFPAWHPYHKEFFVTLIYSLGVVGTAYILKEKAISWREYCLGFNFFLIVGQALLLFSWYEVVEGNPNKNMVSWIGEKGTKYFIFGACVFVFVTAFFMNGFALALSIVEILMALVYVGMRIFYKYLLPAQLYRSVGEAVFVLPIFIL